MLVGVWVSDRPIKFKAYDDFDIYFVGLICRLFYLTNITLMFLFYMIDYNNIIQNKRTTLRSV